MPKQVNALLNVNTVLKWLLIALLIYSLTYSLQVFHGLKALPLLFWLYTKSSKKDGARFWNYLPDLITILVIILCSAMY
jgi:hypothetical protein